MVLCCPLQGLQYITGPVLQCSMCSGSHAAVIRPTWPCKSQQSCHAKSLNLLIPGCCTAGLLKTQALRGTMRDVQTDERAAFAFDMCQASAEQLLQWVYPPLYPVHDTSTPWGKPDDKGR